MAESRRRLVFVGAGRVADVHYASVQALADRCELVGFCDPRPEARDERSHDWGVPGYATSAELYDATSPDAACLFLPHDVHLQEITTAADRGIPVFLEKPISVDLAEARSIRDVVADRGILFFVAHNGLFHPAFERMVELVKAGAIGKPLFARATSAGWLTFREWDFRLSREKTGGGCWIDAGGHLVYCLREIFGESQEVTGFTANLARSEMEGEDHAAGVIRYAGGELAQLFVSYGHKLPGYQHDWPHGYLNAIEVYGDGGGIRYVISPTPELSLFSEQPGRVPDGMPGWLTNQPAEPYAYSFQAELAHFLDCLEGTARPRVTADDAIAVLGTLRGLYESERSASPPRTVEDSG